MSHNDFQAPLHGVQGANSASVKGRGRIVWFLAVPLLLGVAGTYTAMSRKHIETALAATTQAAAAEPVSVMHPQMGDLNDELVLPATLQAYSESPIYARTNGYVQQWFADIGTHVTQGQLLARIDSPEVDQELVHSRAVLDQAQANLKLAGVTAKRYDELIGSNSVAQQEVDQTKQNLTSQQAAVVLGAADVKRLEELQGFERVIAPFSGVITERRTDIGDLINAGNSGMGAELFRLSRIDTMRVFVSVPEAYSQQISNGMHVSLQLTELPNQSFEGKVARTDHAISLATRTLMVEVDVPNPSGKLLPGAYAQVHFKLASPKRPLLLPSGAILFQAAGPQVAVVAANNTVQLRKVVLGRDFGNTIEITDGLSTGDAVISSPPDYLVNGMAVSIQGHADAQSAAKGS
jgi:RND family efflux transporter MFP subunit